ncbi:DUF2070 family protein [Caldivirga sp. UBA161]|uniref:DUF2070 family protein n=1 Tax=Caldivirga sp. UBA161 TaxID=1915569 RepID=UPI0025BC0F0B|nr:DUF2070 family protein [Caldivirga sp. UBA161]
MSRRFERGYGILFGMHAGSLIRLIGLVLMIITPPLILSRIGLNPLYSLLVSTFYILASIALALITMRMTGVGSFRIYYTTVLIIMIESIIIDSAMSIIEGKPVVMAGALAALAPLSLMVSLLKDPVGSRSTVGYLTDLALLLVIVIIIQLPTYLIIGTLTHDAISMPRVLLLDLVLFLISILIMLSMIIIHKVKGTLYYLKMFGAFIYTMITGDGSFMEFHLLRSSKDSDIRIHVIHVTEDNGNDSFIVVPYIHAGPVSHVGGADLIPILVKVAKSMKTKLVYLHGVGGHEVDPASYDDTMIVVNSVKQAMAKLRSSNHTEVIRAKPIIRVESGDIRLVVLPIANGKNLVLVSRIRKSMDDIPTYVYNKAAEELGNDINRFIIVDSQNSFSSDNSWSDDDVQDLINGLRKVLNTPDAEGELRLRVIHIPRSKVPGSFMEIGDNGVYILLMGFNNASLALVVIDGNNIKPDLANEIRRRLEEMGYLAEVVTTDNHQYTGFFGKVGYHVVGDWVSKDELIRLILNAVNNPKIPVVKVSYTEVSSRIRVVGSDGFYGMVRAASSAVSLTPILASLLFIAPIVLSIIATYIIL